MFLRRRRHRQLRRAKPGDGSALKSFRWWQLLTRTLFHLELRDEHARPVRYVVDVRHLATELEGGKIAEGARHAPVEVFREGVQVHIANPPVAVAVPGGVIEVATGSYGLTRMHYVPEHGEPRTLTPHPRTLEGRRARFGRRHPLASRMLALTAIAVLLTSLALTVPQVIELITQLDVVAAQVGTFTSPISLSAEVNVAVFVVGALAAFERALTLRNHWLIDADTTWTAFT